MVNKIKIMIDKIAQDANSEQRDESDEGNNSYLHRDDQENDRGEDAPYNLSDEDNDYGEDYQDQVGEGDETDNDLPDLVTSDDDEEPANTEAEKEDYSTFNTHESWWMNH